MKKNIQPLLVLLFILASLSLRAQEFGLASFYGDDFQGGTTAYNVKYDKNELTTAHKIHPFGTLLRITRLDNKKSVIVKVIDKGPYVKGRIVDLSKKAAQQLGIVEDGSAEVKVEVYQKAPKTSNDTTEPIASNTTKPRTNTSEEVPQSFEDNTRPKTIVLPSRPVSNEPTTPKATPTKTATKLTPLKTPQSTSKSKTAAKGTAPARLVKQDYKQYGLYKIQLERPVKKGFGVQVASLGSYESVMKQVADLQAKSFTNILVSIEKGTGSKSVYKVILGPHDTEVAATSYKSSLKKRYKINGFVVDLATLTY